MFESILDTFNLIWRARVASLTCSIPCVPKRKSTEFFNVSYPASFRFKTILTLDIGFNFAISCHF